MEWVPGFLEKHHPNITVRNRVLGLRNSNMASHFQRVMPTGKSSDSRQIFVVKINPAAKQQRRENLWKRSLQCPYRGGLSLQTVTSATHLPVLHARSCLKLRILLLYIILYCTWFHIFVVKKLYVIENELMFILNLVGKFDSVIY